MSGELAEQITISKSAEISALGSQWCLPQTFVPIERLKIVEANAGARKEFNKCRMKISQKFFKVREDTLKTYQEYVQQATEASQVDRIENELQIKLSAIQKTFMELEEKMFNQIFEKLQSQPQQDDVAHLESTINNAKSQQQDAMKNLLKQLEDDSDN